MIIVFIVLAILAGCDASWHIRHDHAPAQSWDQETLQKEAGTMSCRDPNFVFGTDQHGNLRECL